MSTGLIRLNFIFSYYSEKFWHQETLKALENLKTGFLNFKKYRKNCKNFSSGNSPDSLPTPYCIHRFEAKEWKCHLKWKSGFSGRNGEKLEANGGVNPLYHPPSGDLQGMRKSCQASSRKRRMGRYRSSCRNKAHKVSSSCALKGSWKRSKAVRKKIQVDNCAFQRSRQAKEEKEVHCVFVGKFYSAKDLFV